MRQRKDPRYVILDWLGWLACDVGDWLRRRGESAHYAAGSLHGWADRYR